MLLIAPLPYHQQDTLDFCGAAVAQSMLAARGADLQPQETLFGALNRAGDGTLWNTSPQGLALVLQAGGAPGSERGLRAWFDARPEAAHARIVSTLAGGIPVPVLVNDGQHWLVLTGAFGSPAQSSGAPAVAGFLYHDPYPQTASRASQGMETPPVPHCAGDACGQGGPYGSWFALVTAAGWRRHWWNGPCTRVSPPAYVTVSPAAAAGPSAVRLAAPEPNPPAGSGRIDAATAVARTPRAIAASGIGRDSPLGALLGRTRATGATLVERTDTVAGDYYLVSLATGERPAGLAMIDAADGALLGVQANPRGNPLPRRSRNAVLDALSDLVDPRLLQTRGLTVHPNPVWQPSRESMSPYYPFTRVDVAGSALYLGHDGRAHRRLHTGVRA